jgi:formylglycine-generating enzyme required for sulfatase activity
VLRGGSWNGNARLCRSAGRSGFAPSYRYFNFGLRVVLFR